MSEWIENPNPTPQKEKAMKANELTGEEQGYNEGLEWSAEWLLGQADANDDAVKSFAKNTSESILAHKKPWDRSVSPQDDEDEIECELCGHTKERHPDYVCRACACTDFRPKAEPPERRPMPDDLLDSVMQLVRQANSCLSPSSSKDSISLATELLTEAEALYDAE